MMSIESILRNIYSYLEVLEATHTEVVKHWNIGSLQNALKWGAYCEKIFEQSGGKSYASDLNNHIEKFNKRPWHLGGMYIHLGLLKNASQYILSALLQNPFLSASLFDSLMKMYLQKDKEAFIQVLGRLNQTKAVLDVTLMIQESLTSIFEKKTYGTTNEKTSRDAQLLLRYLKHTHKVTQWDQRTTDFINKELRKVSSTPTGLEVLLICVAEINETHKKQNISHFVEIRNLLESHIIQLLESKFDCRRIHSIPAEMITKAATPSHNDIFCVYLRHLLSDAESFEMDLDPVTFTSTWKGAAAQESLTYTDLVSRLKSLRSTNNECCVTVDELLQSYHETKDSEIWKCLIRDVKR